MRVSLARPLLPGITDHEEALDGMARRAAAVGASFLAAHPLFLKPCSRPTYLSFVREHFPALQADYAKRFATADFAGKEYRERLAGMVDRACRRYGLGKRSSDALLTRNEDGGGRKPMQGAETSPNSRDSLLKSGERELCWQSRLTTREDAWRSSSTDNVGEGSLVLAY